jgi:hypothetical protein
MTFGKRFVIFSRKYLQKLFVRQRRFIYLKIRLIMTYEASLVHPTFDVELWKNRFPLDGLRKRSEFHLEGNIATSPVDIVSNLYIRDNTNIPQEQSRSVPTDLFVPSLGEPQKPFLTKIGGIPFRPIEKKWPEYNGNPMVFTAQFCFLDSLDIVPNNLPGNLLLVFLDEEWPDYIHFEWYEIENVSLKTKNEDIPKEGWLRASWEYETICFSMERFRSVDYPNAFLNTFRCFNINRGAFHVDCFEITKIGGSPESIALGQYRSSFLSENLDFRLLCRIGSVCPCHDVPYPFVNREKPFDLYGKESEHYSILWGDAGGINIYINSQNKLEWEFKPS